MPAPSYAFAHRGGRAHGPDNSLETFRAALSRGATGLETDAWLTADGAVVLDHDGVHRAARRRHLPMSQVRRADLPPHIATLDELYAACGTDFDLAIDVRLPEVAADVVRIARAHQATSRLWLVAPAHDMVRGWRSLAEEVQLAVSIRLVERSPSSIVTAAGAGAHALNMRWPWWSERWVRRVHDAGLLAFGYDAQRTTSLRRCTSLGLDGVFSDHVDRLQTWVEQPRGRST
jgi:glycerophosphoryl diester phosphodiesterase